MNRENRSDTRTWPELAIGLFEELTKRDAEITYEFDNLDVHVPSKVGGEAPRANWTVNGTLRIRTRENARS